MILFFVSDKKQGFSSLLKTKPLLANMVNKSQENANLWVRYFSKQLYLEQSSNKNDDFSRTIF